MIWDDNIGKDATVVVEGNQTIMGKFLGTKRHDSIDFIHLVTKWQTEPSKEGEMPETKFDEVFIQTRKIKSIHFDIEQSHTKELLELYGMG